MNRLLLLGIDFSRAALDLREELSFNPAESRAFYARLSDGFAGELIILSTCNRTEFLIASAAPEAAEQHLLLALRDLRPKARALDQTCCRYRLAGQQAVRHWMGVASGLKSQVVGDAHIARQIRDAADLAFAAGSAGRELRRLVEAVLSAARRVRHQSGIGIGAASVGAAALGAMRRRFEDMNSLRVLTIGAGQAASDIAMHLAKQRFSRLTFAARSRPRAAMLAGAFHGTVADWRDLEAAALEADVIVGAVSSPVTLLTPAKLGAARAAAACARPLLIVDLGVPRNADPSCARLPGVSLLNIDEIQKELSAAQNARELCLPAAEKIIEAELESYQRRQRCAALNPAIRNLYEQADQIRISLLRDRPRDAGELSRIFMKRLLDGPVRRLRRLAAVDERAAATAAWILASPGSKLNREGTEDGTRQSASGG